jgi:hydrogenase/urease accessory protein HupE
VRSDRGILIRYEDGEDVKKAVLREQTPFIDLSHQQSKWELMKEYISLGIFHILSGYDHLMFVMLLFLLSANLRALLFTVTAFTLSHSITLTCGILGIVYMPPPFIESMIALSIIFLAKELYLEHESFTKRHLGIVAFSFGLLHGFGFSSALKDIGLPQSEIPLSLFSFNVGIELGQLLFIFGLTILFFLLQKVLRDIRKFDTILAYITGSLASFWFIQRVLGF